MNTPLPMWYQTSMVRASTKALDTAFDAMFLMILLPLLIIAQYLECVPAACIPHYMPLDRHHRRPHSFGCRSVSPHTRLQLCTTALLAVSLSLALDAYPYSLQALSPTRAGSGSSSSRMQQCSRATRPIEVLMLDAEQAF
jgi:hypothetical protein